MVYTIRIPWSEETKCFEVDTKFYDIEIELITDARLQNSKSPAFIEMVQKTKAIADGRIGFKNGVEGNIKELNEIIKTHKEIFDNNKLAFYVISC